MTDQVTIYHNPRCSKSRQTLQLIRDRGTDPLVIEYLQTPPDSTTLGDVLDALGCQPRDLMRTGEALYTELKLDSDALSRADLIEAMVTHPILIERPIVTVAGQVRIGRPPESVLDILP
jgi:arsenate reductase